MKTVTTIGELRAALDAVRAAGEPVGLVPTMGYLHEGHASLIERAARDGGQVVTTIFVNPLQFAPGEDLDSYPRDPDGDARTAEGAGAALLFAPSLEEMYPGGRETVATSVSVAGLSSVMEGASRPTHFSGMCTVVAKLFNIVGPCRAYFGDKDFQQLAIVRRMVFDLSAPVDVIGCEIVREPDGLAMSSRNVRLHPDERAAAPALHEALRAGAAAILAGERSADAVRALMTSHIATQSLGTLDYVEVADPDTLLPLQVADGRSRLFGAVQFAQARLIDNIAVQGGPADPAASRPEAALS